MLLKNLIKIGKWLGEEPDRIYLFGVVACFFFIHLFFVSAKDIDPEDPFRTFALTALWTLLIFAAVLIVAFIRSLLPRRGRRPAPTQNPSTRRKKEPKRKR